MKTVFTKTFVAALILVSSLACNEAKKRAPPAKTPEMPPILNERFLERGPGQLTSTQIKWGQGFCDRLRSQAKFFLEHPGVIFRFKIKDQSYDGSVKSSDKVSFLLEENWKFVRLMEESANPYNGRSFELLENGQTGFMGQVCTKIFPPLSETNPTPPTSVPRWQFSDDQSKFTSLDSFVSADSGDLGITLKSYSADSDGPPLLTHKYVLIIKSTGTILGKLVRAEWIEYNNAGQKRLLEALLIQTDGV